MTLTRLLSPLTSLVIFILGHGLFNTLLTVRLSAEQVSVQAIGLVPHRFGHTRTARHDHTLTTVQHHRTESGLCLLRQPVERGLQRARQARGGHVAARKAQHPRREPVMAAVRFQITQLGQGEQMPPCCRAGDARALRRQRGVQALPFGVKSFEHRQAFGQAFDVICFGNRHGAAF